MGKGKGKGPGWYRPRDDEDSTCWDFVKGFCPRGDKCKYLHAVAEEEKSAPKAEAALTPGARVQLHGLIMKAKFNDTIGECKSFDEESSRWTVRLPDASTISVRESNLRLVV